MLVPPKGSKYVAVNDKMRELKERNKLNHPIILYQRALRNSNVEGKYSSQETSIPRYKVENVIPMT